MAERVGGAHSPAERITSSFHVISIPTCAIFYLFTSLTHVSVHACKRMYTAKKHLKFYVVERYYLAQPL